MDETRNEREARIKDEFITLDLSWTKNPELCVESIKRDPNTLQFITDPTYELCMEAVKRNGSCLEYVPNDIIDDQLCLEAVKQDGLSYQYVPIRFRNRALELVAVKENGNALQYIIDQTDEIQSNAIINRGSAIQYVENFNYNICLLAIISHKSVGNILHYIPNEFRTEELCIEALKHKAGYLEDIEKEKLTYEICLEAVKAYGNNLKHVPSEFRTDELILVAVKNGYNDVLKYVVDPSYQMCLTSILKYPDSFIHCTMTPELCILAVYLDPDNIEYIPNDKLTYEICVTAIEKRPSIINYIRNLSIDPELKEKCNEYLNNRKKL